MSPLTDPIGPDLTATLRALKLGKLTYLYDDNHVSLDGPTAQAFTEDVLGRYAAYGWQVLKAVDGLDAEAVHRDWFEPLPEDDDEDEEADEE